LTALLDFDFAYVGSLLDPYLCPFNDFKGQLPGPVAAAADATVQARRKAILTGDWSGVRIDDEDMADIAAAKAWYDALMHAGATTPHNLSGSERLSAIWELCELLCPAIICNKVVSEHRSLEQRLKDVEEARADVEKALELLGA
jgi:hypothetical protein